MKFSLETEGAPQLAPQPIRIITTMTRGWAYLGGFLLLLITVLEAANAGMKLFTGAASAAETEVVKYIVGIALFTFLPYCQISNGHIAVDIFTQGAGERAKAFMALLGSILGAVIAIVLIKQMSLGMQSYIDYKEITPILKLPIWTAFPFVLISLVLWLLACFCTAYLQLRDISGAKSSRGEH